MLKSGWLQHHAAISTNLLRRGQTQQYCGLTLHAGQLGMDGFPVRTSNTAWRIQFQFLNQTKQTESMELKGAQQLKLFQLLQIRPTGIKGDQLRNLAEP